MVCQNGFLVKMWYALRCVVRHDNNWKLIDFEKSINCLLFHC